MTTAVGVFNLGQIRSSMLIDDFVPLPGKTHAYGSGGVTVNTQTYSGIDRFSLSNDTASSLNRGNITIGLQGAGGVNNSTDGWLFNGYIPTSGTSYLQRITFSNDLNSVTKTNTTLSTLTVQGVVTSKTAAYNCGYGNGVGSFFNGCQRFVFSNDTTAASSNTSWPSSGYQGSGYNGKADGWSYGQFVAVGSCSSSIYRLTFSIDATAAVIKGSLTSNRSGTFIGSNQEDVWNAGGTNGTTNTSTTDRHQLVSDTVNAIPRTSLVIPHEVGYGAFTQSDMWMVSGVLNAVFGTIVQRITYANDTTPVTRGGSTPFSYPAVHGW